MKLFAEVMEKVRKEYVDGTNLTYQELVYSSLKGMINTLDPHSEFMDAQKYKDLQNDTEGHFGGLGIVISMKDNFCDRHGADGRHAGSPRRHRVR